MVIVIWLQIGIDIFSIKARMFIAFPGIDGITKRLQLCFTDSLAEG